MTVSTSIRRRYLVAGLVIGTLWLVHGGQSPWMHALRLLVLMGIVMAVAALVRRLAAARGRRLPHHPIGRFLAAKIAMLGLALFVATAFDWLPYTDVWIAFGLAVAVLALGPRMHPWLMRRPAAIPFACPIPGGQS